MRVDYPPVRVFRIGSVPTSDRIGLCVQPPGLILDLQPVDAGRFEDDAVQHTACRVVDRHAATRDLLSPHAHHQWARRIAGHVAVLVLRTDQHACRLTGADLASRIRPQMVCPIPDHMHQARAEDSTPELRVGLRHARILFGQRHEQEEELVGQGVLRGDRAGGVAQHDFDPLPRAESSHRRGHVERALRSLILRGG